jgi:Rieske Fe-S protein
MTQDVSGPERTSLTRRAVPAAVVVVGAAAGFGIARGHRAGSGAGANAAAAHPASGDAPLATVDQIPAGGGLILDQAKVVLTKDAAGTVRAFSAICTHQGCVVSEVSGGTINCPCHGSRFDVATGAPVAGPASSPLPPAQVSVRGDAIFSA